MSDEFKELLIKIEKELFMYGASSDDDWFMRLEQAYELGRQSVLDAVDQYHDNKTYAFFESSEIAVQELKEKYLYYNEFTTWKDIEHVMWGIHEEAYRHGVITGENLK